MPNPFSIPLMCGQQDLNLHGLPLEPKSSASANSAMTADTGKSTTKIGSAQLYRFLYYEFDLI